ncbi:hypothetical protein FOC33_00425 [Plesiomonas shigelloides]|uniref:hypothetical protein n=1 Tax=Plesiomonas shigelloides TaxID=703 RepID=UPI00143E27F8|nr:hypothetical protein [Plesiomonas shigelloides]QIY07533.1 hypothetical protein FOC33_00425 [Plesiomonas shigelloides]
MRLLIPLLFFVSFLSNASGLSCSSYDLTDLIPRGSGAISSTSQEIEGGLVSAPTTEIAESLLQSFVEPTRKLSVDKIQSKMPSDASWWCSHKDDISQVKFWGSGKYYWQVSVHYMYYNQRPKQPCDTPKTDDQCNKGKTATITGNDVFWASGNYKGCTFTAADGVFIKLADGSMTGDATSTGSTGKSWCETTDSSYNPADDEALSKNPAFSPAKDNDPKNCKNGWVQAGGGKFHCLNDTSGNVDAPPDKVNPEDGSINSDKDGKPKPPDAGVGKPPTGGTDPDGGGGTGPDGGGGDCEGEDCEGGGGGTKPPARPADPWADILDAADVARVKADTQSVQDELADFYRSAASGFQININKPAAGAMPSYGDITQGGQKISLSMSWLDKISFADGRAGVLVLCSLIAAYIILVRR